MESLALYTMGLCYILAGIVHFVKPAAYLRIMPPWLPLPLHLVYLSGVFEIVGGILLFPAATRVIAAWGIIVLLIVIFPANIQMMLNYYRRKNPYAWLTVARLPLQALLIWWAWQYTIIA